MKRVRLDTPALRARACSRRAPAPPRRCSRATCCCCPSAGGPRSRASSCPRTSSSRSRRRRRSSRAAGSSWPTRSTRSALEVAGRRALDVGASTGGFTDCLLQRGAAHVVALDVAYGELDWRLRGDPRVTVIERRNARVAARRRASVRARPDRDRRLVHLARQGAAGGARVRRAAVRLPGAGQAPVRGRPRGRRQGRRRARRGAAARGAAATSGGRRAGSAPRCSATRAPGCRGRRATSRRSCGWPSAGASGRRGPRAGGSARWSREADPHRDGVHAPAPGGDRAGDREPARARAARLAPSCGSIPRRRASTRLEPADGLELDAPLQRDVDICFALGGDGTILSALRDLRGHRRARVRGQLRRDRLPGDGRSRARPTSGFARAFARRLRGAGAAGDRALRRPRAAGWRSTTSRSTASRASGSPTSRTRSGATRSAASAATGSWSRRPPARRATTSPTAAR